MVKFKGPDWMPEKLENDQTGNKEANAFIFDSLDQLRETLLATEARYGRGAAQVHVVYRYDTALSGQAGFIAFSGDRAQLKNLEKGYAKFLKDPTYVPGKTLSHFALAPMDNSGLEAARRNENIVTNGGTPTLLQWDGRRFFSTVFRIDKYSNGKDMNPDLNLVGYELRQFNYDYEGLLDETEAISTILEKGVINTFARFDRDSDQSVLQGFLHEDLDTLKIWNNSLMKVDANLRENFEPYFFGFRNWAEHPILDSLPAGEKAAMKAKIHEAQRQMFKEFVAVIKQKQNFLFVTDELALSLVKFAHTVQLGPLFDQYEMEVVGLKP